MHKPIQVVSAALSTLLVSSIFSLALAWSDDIENLKDVNTVCKLEPEAQCTSAIRIELQAPGINMSHSSMEKMRLDRANLSRANLSFSILHFANLKEANLMLSNLEGAHLHAANLRGANLMMSNMKKVNLLDADLSGANLRGANMLDAIIIKAKFDGATWTDGRTCAEHSIGKCL